MNTNTVTHANIFGQVVRIMSLTVALFCVLMLMSVNGASVRYIFSSSAVDLATLNNMLAAGFVISTGICVTGNIVQRFQG